MRTPRLLSTFAIVLPFVCAVATPAQTPRPAPPADALPAVDEIVAKHLAARGGAEKIAAIQSLMLTGRIDYGPNAGGDGPITVRILRPAHIRQDFIIQTHAGIRAYDGKIGWQRMPSGTGRPLVELLSGPELKNIQDEAENGIDGPLVNAREKGNRLELTGRETFDDKACYAVKVTLRSGHVMRLYLDVDSFLEVGERLTRSMNGKDVEIEESVGDYRDVGGVLFPHLYTSGLVKGPRDTTLRFEKIIVNPSLDEMIFRPPTPPEPAAPRKPTGVKPAPPKKPAPSAASPASR